MKVPEKWFVSKPQLVPLSCKFFPSRDVSINRSFPKDLKASALF